MFQIETNVAYCLECGCFLLLPLITCFYWIPIKFLTDFLLTFVIFVTVSLAWLRCGPLKINWDTKRNRSSRPEVFCQKSVLRNFTKFTGKHLYQSLFFNKVADLRPATLSKKRPWRRCFPVNFVKFLRTPFFHRTPMVAASEGINKNLLRLYTF